LPAVPPMRPRRSSTMANAISSGSGIPRDYRSPATLRVVRSEEKLTQNRYRRGKLQPETNEHEWLWITTLDSQAFPATLVRRLGHDRWKQENNGWNDLIQNWAFKHGFLHACRAPPPQRIPRRASASRRQPWIGRRLLHSAAGIHALFRSCLLSLENLSSLLDEHPRSSPLTSVLGIQTSTPHSRSRCARFPLIAIPSQPGSDRR
jgi:hypothetical protein